MDASAIQRIEQLSAAAGHLDTDTPIAIVPQGSSVVSLERFRDSPVRQRAVFRTHHLAAFLAYIEKHSNPYGSEIFVDPRNLKSQAVLDLWNETDPGWSDHQAHLTLLMTPEFSALNELAGPPQSQRKILDWIEDWSDLLAAYSGDARIDTPRALAAIRKIDIKSSGLKTTEEGDLRASRSSLETVEIANSEFALPDRFVLRSNPFEDVAEREIHVRLSVRTGDKEPQLVLRILGLKTLLKQVADELASRIAGAVELPVHIGTIETKQP